MARIRICLEDDNGHPLSPDANLFYILEGSCQTLDAIDDAVEEWRKKALPDIQKALLTKAQQDAIAKKTRRKVQRNLSPQSANTSWRVRLSQPEVLVL